ncbi:aprataxin [Galleria mellonella]|uniref:Aprataxin n=1 Tax=Galleria mellonella TaxID=7137 RepID=A0A6J1X043_GALME|nr:aprataxin [Galleria mellonella]
MSKRKLGIMTGSGTTKQPRHWSLGLLGSMEDPESIVKKTERIVVIRDKYPKAKIHYLVLPYEDINSIYKLTEKHTSLLEEFGKLYEELKEKHKESNLRAGFHAVPSMQRLHMHVISTDMISPCLKTKVHWNSFTTRFFIPYQDVLKGIKEDGGIKKISNELHKSLMSTELICNQCNFKPKNMPQLKEHLLTHVK